MVVDPPRRREAAVEAFGDARGAVRVAGQQHDRRVVAGLGAEVDLRHGGGSLFQWRALETLPPAAIERALARRHLAPARSCCTTHLHVRWRAAAARSRPTATAATTGPTGPRSVFGLLTDARAARSRSRRSAGNTADPATLEAQLAKLRDSLRPPELVLVGDRGMLTQRTHRAPARDRRHRLGELPAGTGAISRLVDAGDLQLCLFDERDLAEITTPTFPGERLVVCRNPVARGGAGAQARGALRD